MPVSTDQTENKNGLASDTASPLKVKSKAIIQEEDSFICFFQYLVWLQDGAIFHTHFQSMLNFSMHTGDLVKYGIGRRGLEMKEGKG